MADVSDYVEIVGYSAGMLEQFTTGAIFVIVLKLISVLCAQAASTLNLVDGLAELRQLKISSTVTMRHHSITLKETADVAMYERSLHAYEFFFVLAALSEIMYFAHCVRRKSQRTSFIHFYITIFCEMPLMITEVYMMKAARLINWHEERYDMIFHITYIINLFISFSFDFIRSYHVNIKSRSGISVIIFCMPAAFLYAAMWYAPVSWAMVGWKGFTRIELTDFGGVIVSDDAENILLVLMIVGHVGQFLWALFLIYLVLCCKLCICMSECCDKMLRCLNSRYQGRGRGY